MLTRCEKEERETIAKSGRDKKRMKVPVNRVAG